MNVLPVKIYADNSFQLLGAGIPFDCGSGFDGSGFGSGFDGSPAPCETTTTEVSTTSKTTSTTTPTTSTTSTTSTTTSTTTTLAHVDRCAEAAVLLGGTDKVCGKNAKCVSTGLSFYCQCVADYFGNPEIEGAGCSADISEKKIIFPMTISLPIIFVAELDNYFTETFKFYKKAFEQVLEQLYLRKKGYIKNSVRVVRFRYSNFWNNLVQIKNSFDLVI